MDLIVLAGGFGTRLRSVVSDVPKPMAPVGDKPFLARLLDFLVPQGVTRIILSVYYQKEVIEGYFGDQYLNIPVVYVREPAPLGTGGAILLAMKELSLPAGRPVLVVNGDTWLDLDVQKFLTLHQQQQAVISMALVKVNNVMRFGSVEVQNNQVVSFNEKDRQDAGLINAGMYLIDPIIWQNIDLPSCFSFETELLVPFIEKLKPQAFITKGAFIDIGLPEDYQRFKQDHGVAPCKTP